MTPSDHSDALPSRRELRRRREQHTEEAPVANLEETESTAPDASRSRRAADSPVDAPSTTASHEVVNAADHPRRRSRRADADVTSHPRDASTATSSIPVVAPQDVKEAPLEDVYDEGPTADRPLTRRELRELRRRDTNDTAETPAAQTGDDTTHSDSTQETPVWDESGLTSTQSFKVAMGISDTGMLNSIDAEREAIAREAAALNQKIQEHGVSNPHHIDPELLREQQALAERARALAERHQTEEFTDENVAPAGDEAAPEPVDTAGAQPDAATASPTALAEQAPEHETPDEPTPESVESASAPRRRSDVDQTRSVTASERPEPPRNEPIGAQAAHGLDPLDTREWTSRERTYMTVSAIVFAVGIITLIIGLILMLR
ncbi:MAG: hypothetical protein ACTHZ5_11880 [Micrococcaceae bacterium]